MLERYFLRPQTVDRIRNSWIGEPIERYVGWLTDKGYAARTVLRRVPMLVRFGEFARERGAQRLDVLSEHIGPFTEHWLQQGDDDRRSERRRRHLKDEVSRPIRHMLALALPDEAMGKSGRRDRPQPFATHAPRFFDHLRNERGLKPASIAHYHGTLHAFEHYCQQHQLVALGSLSPVFLSGFITTHAPGLSRSGKHNLCANLKVFLRYLHRHGVTARDLSDSVGAPNTYRLSEIPRSISWDEVRRMLEAVDRRTVTGRRDYAILLLLVTYGLRGCEVAALTLDDIDWKHERLRVPERKAAIRAPTRFRLWWATPSWPICARGGPRPAAGSCSSAFKLPECR